MGNFFLGITVGAAALLILSYFQNSAFFSLLPLIYIDLQNENPCDILALMQENDDADIADIVLLKLASFHWWGLWQGHFWREEGRGLEKFMEALMLFKEEITDQVEDTILVKWIF